MVIFHNNRNRRYIYNYGVDGNDVGDALKLYLRSTPKKHNKISIYMYLWGRP